MQDRLKEIIDRFTKGKNAKGWRNKAIRKFIVHAPEDVGFLLNEITEIQDVFKQSIISLETTNELLKQSQEREQALRDFIDNEFCANFKTLHQRSTVCYPPDEGKCGKYHECRALDKELNKGGQA